MSIFSLPKKRGIAKKHRNTKEFSSLRESCSIIVLSWHPTFLMEIRIKAAVSRCRDRFRECALRTWRREKDRGERDRQTDRQKEKEEEELSEGRGKGFPLQERGSTFERCTRIEIRTYPLVNAVCIKMTAIKLLIPR